MKIAFIGQKGIPAKSGGVEKHVTHLAVKLAERGHEVFVYVRRDYTDKEILQYKGVELIHIPSVDSKNLGAITHTFFSVMHALFQDYDVVHIHSIGPNSLNFLIRIFKPKTVLIATYHCQDYFHQKWGRFARAYLRFGEYMTCHVPDKTIAVTHILQNFIQKKYGREVEMISSGTEVSRNSNFDRLAQWNLEKGGYILAVSRLIRRNGLHYLVSAFKELEKKNLTQGKKLVIVGDGLYTTQYVKRLKHSALASENIIFTGVQTGENLSQLFSQAHFFVQPSDVEGLSMALLEAMGYGVAVIASNIPENLEVIGEGSGISFSQGNVTDLQEKMAVLMNNQVMLESLSEAGLARVQEAYNWNRIASQTDALYREVLRKKSNKQFYTQKSNI